jgi:hypothetical protein
MYPMVDSMDDWPSGTSLLVRALDQNRPFNEKGFSKALMDCIKTIE